MAEPGGHTSCFCEGFISYLHIASIHTEVVTHSIADVDWLAGWLAGMMKQLSG